MPPPDQFGKSKLLKIRKSKFFSRNFLVEISKSKEGFRIKIWHFRSEIIIGCKSSFFTLRNVFLVLIIGHYCGFKNESFSEKIGSTVKKHLKKYLSGTLGWGPGTPLGKSLWGTLQILLLIHLRLFSEDFQTNFYLRQSLKIF